MRRGVLLAVYAPFVVVLSTGGCERELPPASSVPYEIRDSAGVAIIENRRPSLERTWTVEDSPLVRIGHEPGRPENELYRVTSALRLSDGRLVIGNGGTNEVRWYSASGEFVRAAGGAGDGPGEFRQLERVFALPGDSVAVGDYVLQRLSVYDANGDLVRTVTQRAVEQQLISPRARFSDGTLLWATSGFALSAEGPTRIERLGMSVYRLSATGGSAEAVAKLPWIENVIGPAGGVRPDGSEVIGRNHRSFGRSSWLSADAEGWIFGDNAAPEIQVHAIDGRITKIIRWSATPRVITEDDVQRDEDWNASRNFRQDPAVRERMRRAREAYPPPPDTMPWFGCPEIACRGRPLLLDAERNVWVQTYQPPAEGPADRYEVFDSAGVWLGAVTMPSGLEVLSIGSEHVVGRMRNELDVESVAVYRIEKA